MVGVREGSSITQPQTERIKMVDEIIDDELQERMGTTPQHILISANRDYQPCWKILILRPCTRNLMR